MRDPDAATALSDLGVELVPGDLADAAALDRLCEGADGLFHVAGWYKVGSPDPEVGHHVNVDGTRNALEAARTKSPLTLPVALVRATAALAAVVGRAVPLPADYSAEALRASVATYLGDPSRAQQELGWSARGLDEGLAQTVAVLR